MFHSDIHFTSDKGDNDKNNEGSIERQNSLDRFLRDLRPIKVPLDESLKSTNPDSLMPQKMKSLQEYYDPEKEGQRRKWQWEINWNAAMKECKKMQKKKIAETFKALQDKMDVNTQSDTNQKST
jgi:hypothetical protein